MKAFLIDGTEGILINPGVWHYGPVPLAPQAIYANVEALGTNRDDFHRADIGSELGVEVKIEL
jgi:ureidoglycolate hydrolase